VSGPRTNPQNGTKEVRFRFPALGQRNSSVANV
jgi:hypothetical protein